jgi:hypothetical protein
MQRVSSNTPPIRQPSIRPRTAALQHCATVFVTNPDSKLIPRVPGYRTVRSVRYGWDLVLEPTLMLRRYYGSCLDVVEIDMIAEYRLLRRGSVSRRTSRGLSSKASSPATKRLPTTRLSSTSPHANATKYPHSTAMLRTSTSSARPSSGMSTMSKASSCKGRG